MIVMDWENAEIGDPAYDVAMVNTRAQSDFVEKTADRFVHECLKHFDENVGKFYSFVSWGHLALVISQSSVLSNSLRTYEIRGPKAFLSFPFLSLPFVAKRTGADSDIIWVEKKKVMASACPRKSLRLTACASSLVNG